MRVVSREEEERVGERAMTAGRSPWRETTEAKWSGIVPVKRVGWKMDVSICVLYLSNRGEVMVLRERGENDMAL